MRWSIKKSDHGYSIISKSNAWCLDVEGYDGVSNGSNVHVWSDNGNPYQRWCFIPYNPKKTVDDGIYKIHPAKDTTYCLDVSGSASKKEYKNNQNIQLWDNTGDDSFKIEYVSDGYYRIQEVSSGLYVDICNGNGGKDFLKCGTNIQLFSKTSSRGQLWSIQKLYKNTYTFISALNGYCLDLENGVLENGRNVSQYTLDSITASHAQRWTLEPVNDSTGDVNNDSKFNATDAVQLKKFLLGITTLKAPENADLNGDGKINVFDLIAMKRRLTSK